MQSSFDRSSLVTVVGSVAAVGLLIQAQVAMCGMSDSSNQDQTSGQASNVSASNDTASNEKSLAKQSNEDRNFLPHLGRTRPIYPREALQEGVEGYVVVQFDVTEDGTVENAVVLESDPPDVFDSSATKAALDFRFRPKIIDGSPVRVEGVKRKIVFEFEHESPSVRSGATEEDSIGYLPIVEARAEYPQRAFDRGIEGFVTVEFTVSETGNVEDPVVVESDPPGIFDRAAIHAALQFKYRPRIVDGTTVRVDGVQHKIDFKLEDESTASDFPELDRSGAETETKVEDGDYLWIIKFRPKYPPRALKRGIEGFATVEFTVTEKGNVANPFVVEADPPGIFDRVSIHAASRFKYRPRVVDGSPVLVEGVLHRFDFKLEDGTTVIESQELDGSSSAIETTVEGDEYLPIVKVGAKYPRRALKRGIEGFATVEFAVSVKGNVEDPVVVESDPPGIFDRAAIHAVLQSKYRPRIVDGMPVRVEGVKHKIVFEIENLPYEVRD